ncbi:pyridoxal phosphate-dependent transferase [Lasiosphaeria hispida]|uniref:Pyridoxal phosphate-dependent transferase n=1 Tax=Lasiosphaeria hispida TaxID=260671 RepID=A0AAJ0MFJ9_9PEZI|nr:pyridoxal phosphate-dependent transferase [Lasiosphaeria hispida]
MAPALPGRAWGTKLPPGSAARIPAAVDRASWGDPMQTGSAFDFRTDAISTPSLRQLAAISRATLNDDVFGEDQTTTLFERRMADVCGQQAGAFVISGTMANQLALGALCQYAPYAVLADASAHVVNFEAGGLAHLSGAMVQPVQPSNGVHLTAEDVKRHAKVAPDAPFEACLTRVISLENTVHGNVIPLEDLRAIKDWAGKHDIMVHIDGARIWEAVACGAAGTLAEIASCTDALTLSFAKGIGAPIGAMVVGTAEVIHRVKRLRQSIGGGVRKVGVLAAAAQEAVLENFGPGDVDSRGILRASHGMAEAVATMWTTRGGRLTRPTETNMVWLDLTSASLSPKALNDGGLLRGVLIAAPRIVLHHQICPEALASLEQVFVDVLVNKHNVVETSNNSPPSKGCV